MSNSNPLNDSASEGNPNAWESCQGGELQTLGKSLRDAERQRRNSQVVKQSILASAAIVLLAFSINMLQDKSTPLQTSISCEECLDRFVAYEQYLTEDADMTAQDASNMAGHLSVCPKCREHFEEEYPGLLSKAGISIASAFSLFGLFAMRRKTNFS